MEINEQGRIDTVNSMIEHLQRRTVANVTVLLKCHADFLQGLAINAAVLDRSGIQEETKLFNEVFRQRIIEIYNPLYGARFHDIDILVVYSDQRKKMVAVDHLGYLV